jgi:hypothetical protein
MADERRPLLDGSGLLRSRLSQISAHSITSRFQDNPDYPVDHGYVAWMQVLGGFILFANSWCVVHKKDVRLLTVKGACPIHLVCSKPTTSKL